MLEEKKDYSVYHDDYTKKKIDGVVKNNNILVFYCTHGILNVVFASLKSLKYLKIF